MALLLRLLVWLGGEKQKGQESKTPDRVLRLSRDGHREESGFMGTGSWLLMTPKSQTLEATVF